MPRDENSKQKLLRELSNAGTEQGKMQKIEEFFREEIAKRNEVLIDLINAHNPYTKNDLPDKKDNLSHMNVFSGNPDPDNIEKNNINQIELEVDGPYTMGPMEWNFKGSPQKINKTIRIKYRYRARDLDNPQKPPLEPAHWVTAYLLIGYEDGGA